MLPDMPDGRRKGGIEMANLKAAKSHRLGYPKPKTVTGPAMPQPATLVDPVSYIRFWDKYNHREPVDISKSKKMTRADLMKADPRGIELMLAYGVSQKQIAMQYNTPLGSLTAIFKRMGVDTKVESVVEGFGIMDLPANSESEETLPEAPPAEYSEDPAVEVQPDIQMETAIITNEVITDPAQIAQLMPEPEPEPVPQITWFYGLPRSGAIPTLTVYEDNRIALPTVIRKQYGTKRIRIGVTDIPVNIIIGETDKPEFGVKIADSQSRVRCDGICQMLKDKGILLPAKFKMVWDEFTRLWSGTLLEP